MAAPLRIFFSAIVTSTILSTTWACWETARHMGVGRVRDVGFGDTIWRYGATFGLTPRTDGRWLAWFSRQTELESWGSFLEYLALMLVLNLGAALLLGLVAAPLVLLLLRVYPADRGKYSEWFWGKFFPISAGAVFLLPEITRTFSFGSRFSSAVPTAIPARWLLLGAACVVLAALPLLPAAPRLRRLLGVAASLSVAACLFAVAAGLVARAAAGGDEPSAVLGPGAPNVLLISLDTLRADHLSSYGYQRETSPTIDQAAREGVRFARAMAPSPWTLPSHVTLLTGLHPIRHGVRTQDSRMNRDAVLLSEVLRQAGYHTAGFVDTTWLDSTFGFFQGFDHYDDYRLDSSRDGEYVVRAWREWLAGWSEQGRERPFFAFVHFYDIHSPYSPPEPFRSLFKPESEHGAIDGRAGSENEENGAPESLAQSVAMYDGAIRHTDDLLRRMFEYLREIGAYDETLLVITSDHGEEFMEHGGLLHSATLYDEVLHVPLVFRMPKLAPAGAVITSQARLEDVGPTIVGLLGIDPPEGFGAPPDSPVWGGQDLSRLILSGGGGDLPALGDLQDEPPGMVSLSDGRFKLIRVDGGGEELFDLASDPRESLNLMEAQPERHERMTRALLEWQALFSGQSGFAKPATLNGEQIETLRGLGYIK